MCMYAAAMPVSGFERPPLIVAVTTTLFQAVTASAAAVRAHRPRTIIAIPARPSTRNIRVADVFVTLNPPSDADSWRPTVVEVDLVVGSCQIQRRKSNSACRSDEPSDLKPAAATAA